MSVDSSRTVTGNDPGISRLGLLTFAVTIFASAFLLFQVQPLISRFILPWFGGSPAVWSTCMLFFQVLLFGGYVYAHLLTSRLSPRAQACLHIGLLIIAGMTLPITPDDSWKPAPHDAPMFRIVALLGTCVGLPYFILASTGPLLQKWFSLRAPGTSPYRLYALSNVGSLLALVSYPFVVEPAMNSPMQAELWSWTFGGFAVLCSICAIGLLRKSAFSNMPVVNESGKDHPTNAMPLTWTDRVTWFGLAMVASVMLLATTNQVCLDVATVPFLWILPLTIYLLSFILCFDGDHWYRRTWYLALLVVSLLVSIQILTDGSRISIVVQVVVYLISLFFCCMVCHGELARQKPGAKHLTSFYLTLSAGGAGGGLFVGLIAPSVFPAYWEMHFGIVACLIATLVVLFRDKTSLLYAGKPRRAWAILVMLLCIVTWNLQGHAGRSVASAIEVSRNFYGVLRVDDEIEPDPQKSFRKLLHGSILHGSQFLSKEKQQIPTTYYGYKSGVGLVLKHHRAGESRHIGVIGLGVGTLAAHGTATDTIHFYEINPEVLRLAEEHFSFLRDTQASVDTILGDARLTLEHEKPQQFDVLVLDAFSGDAIPTHLLTKEAAEVYMRHLNDDGILCVHISNLHFDLRPVVLGIAKTQGLRAACIESNECEDHCVILADWMVLSKKPIPQAILDDAERLVGMKNNAIVWTDEWSNLLSVLR